MRSEVESQLLQYKEEDKNGLLEYISSVIQSKGDRWERSTQGEDCELTQMFIYEYVTSLEKISGGRLPSKFLVDKMARNLHTLRYGNFREGKDDNIQYGNQSVTSRNYNMSRPGAHTIQVSLDDELSQAVVLFDGSQRSEDGKKLNGINLNDIDDIRHTIFHEWTHVMEKSLIPRRELNPDEIIHKEGNSTYINASASADFDDLGYYLEYITDAQNNTENPVAFGGVSTIEINPQKSSRRIMHNQISEGFTEYISRFVMNQVGRQVKDPSRYENQVELAKKVFESRGMESTITDYITAPYKIISELEKGKIHGKDLLHYYQYIESILGYVDRTATRYMGKDADILRQQVEGFWKNPPTREDAEKFIDTTFTKMSENNQEFAEQDKSKVHDAFYNVIYFPSLKKEYTDEIENHYRVLQTPVGPVGPNAGESNSTPASKDDGDER